MTTTFGRRAAPGSAQPSAAAPRIAPVDPRLEALAASVRDPDPARAELKAYFARRRAAIGPWGWVVNGLHVAAPVASYILHAPMLWIGAISAASVASRMLLKRGRQRWVDELEAQTGTPES